MSIRGKGRGVVERKKGQRNIRRESKGPLALPLGLLLKMLLMKRL